MLAIARLAGELGVPFVFHHNIDYGTSGPEAGLAEIEDALVKVPGTRVSAGAPAPMSYADATTKARDALAALSADQRDKIAYKNLQRLLKLS